MSMETRLKVAFHMDSAAEAVVIQLSGSVSDRLSLKNEKE